MDVTQQEEQVFVRYKRALCSGQRSALARCMEVSARYYGVSFNQKAVKVFSEETTLAFRVTTAIRQQSLQYTSHLVAELSLNDTVCPYVLIDKNQQDVVLIIPAPVGKNRVYFSAGQVFNSVDTLVLDNYEPVCYEILPDYGETDLTLKSVFYWCLFKANAPTFIVYGIITLFIAMMSMVPPIAMGYLINHVIGVADTQVIATMAFLMGGCALGILGLTFLRGLLILRCRITRRYVMLSGLMSRFFSVPLNYFSQCASGEAQQVLNVFGMLVNQSISLVTQLGTCFVFLCLSYALMFYFFWEIALVQLLLAFFVMAMIFVLLWLKKKPLWQSVNKQGQSLDRCFEHINTIEKFMLFDKTQTASEACQQSVFDYISADYVSYLYDIYKTLLIILLQGVSVIITFFMVHKLYGDTVNVGQLISFLSITVIFLGYVISLLSYVGQYFILQIRYRKVDQFFSVNAQAHPGVTMLDIQGGLQIQNLSFCYDKRDALNLSHINVHILAGQNVAILGKSGCGKTTLLKLLIGLLQADEGNILIDNCPIDALDIRHYRTQVAFFSQQDKLFNGSVKDNITLGERYSDDEIWQALADAECEVVVSRLPMQLNSIVSDNVSPFSDGEQKRLLLARCLVKKPKLLFLDEVLNGLDPYTAKCVMDNLLALDATCVFTCHQVMCFDRMDLVYRLEQGGLHEVISDNNEPIH